MSYKKKRTPARITAKNEQRKTQRAQRVALALKLRADGKSLTAIAEELQVSVGTAKDYWAEALRELQASNKADAGELRAVMLARLEELISKWSGTANDPSKPNAPQGAAIVIKAMERQSSLLGLDKIADTSGQLGEVDISEALKSKAARDALRRMLDEAERAANIRRSENAPERASL